MSLGNITNKKINRIRLIWERRIVMHLKGASAVRFISKILESFRHTTTDMIIHFENPRFQFFAVPKTASTSIHESLCKALDKAIPHGPSAWYHARAVDVHQILAPEWESFFSFAFTRNPIDRFVSAYRDLKYLRRFPVPEFSNFCETLQDSPWRNNYHFLPISDFVCDATGKKIVKYIGRYEELETGMRVISRQLHLRLSLPHLRANTTDIQVSSHNRKLIEKYYERDFDLFGY